MYWQNRQKQLTKALEKSEAELKKRLTTVYDEQYSKLEKEIAAYYQTYGVDNVIEYRKLMQALPEKSTTSSCET